MSGIFGALGIADTDRVKLQTVGQQVIYEAVNQVLDRYNADLAAAMSVFFERETEDYQWRYKLPGGGRLQRTSNRAPTGAVKATGQWDVAFPLEGFGANLSSNRIDFAYMTVQDLDRHLKTIFTQDVNTVRFEMLKALFNSAQDTFTDPLHGSLSIEPLANGDSVVYPPVLGSEDEATDNHYLESGYAATAISDSNNPYITIKDELEEHFGSALGGSDIVTFINPAEVPETEDLSDFDPIPDRYVRQGSDKDIPFGLPSVPGKVIGRTNGVWVVEWRWMPASYALAVDLGVEAPLIGRVDPSDTGLPRGLAMVSGSDRYPFTESYWEHRFGFGVGNRLNGVVMEFGTGGTYTVPTAYQ